MAHSSYDHVLNGRTRPLTPAPCTLAVWQPVLPPALLAPTHPDSPLQCDHEARGYRFAWGHVLESVAPPDPECAEGLLIWDFVLEDAQEQYQALGGNLEELADMALVFLDTSMPHAGCPMATASSRPPSPCWCRPRICPPPACGCGRF